LAASARLAAGLVVLMSIRSLPGPRPARIPSGPSAMACSAAALVTMEKITSEAWATARGESAQRIPRFTNPSAFARVRL